MINGHTEKVPSEQIHTAEMIWYLYHRAVITDKKPDKLHVVFDCATRFKGNYLNERGPDLVNTLLHFFLRFRQHRYAIRADIESMYHQVRIPIDNRDVLRCYGLRKAK